MQDDEEVVVQKKAESGSEESDSGSEDQGRGAVKRKAPAAKVVECFLFLTCDSNSFFCSQVL